MKRTIVAGILPAIALSVHAKPQDAVSLLAALVVHDAVVDNSSPFPYDPGFPIEKVAQLAFSLPTHSWEYGTSAQASIELYNRDASVFGANPFPEVHDVSALRSFNALVYAADKITLGKGVDGLSEGNGAVGDPASLGVAAILIGKDQKAYADAASKSVNYMLTRAPRMPNGAISHRANVAEVWADFVYMAPPTIAYYGADTKNATILREAVRQCGLYREILQADLPTTSPLKGLWRHIIGPQSKDTGLWATGNAWAAGGMSRVLATVLKAPVARDAEWKSQAVTDLTQYIKEILDGARGAPLDNGLLRNYLDNTSGDGHGFGEIAGSTMLAATAYRMAVIDPKTFGAEYIQWADTIRIKMGGKDASGNPYITSNGTATPAVNPLAWLDKKPFTSGSPEGQAFVLLMYTAWRDCINAGICSKSSTTTPTRRSHNFSKRRLHNHH